MTSISKRAIRLAIEIIGMAFFVWALWHVIRDDQPRPPEVVEPATNS